MNDVTRKLRAPAIALISLGALNVLSGVILILGRLVRLVQGTEPVITDDARRLGYELSGIYFPIVSLISIAVAPIIIFGSIRMMRAQNYPVAILAAILAMIPLSSVCCILGFPLGLWALIVLRDPDVRKAFQSPPTTNR
jgi:uncharacterized membrane protein YphA (DoxX/SURF4 family)